MKTRSGKNRMMVGAGLVLAMLMVFSGPMTASAAVVKNISSQRILVNLETRTITILPQEAITVTDAELASPNLQNLIQLNTVMVVSSSGQTPSTGQSAESTDESPSDYQLPPPPDEDLGAPPEGSPDESLPAEEESSSSGGLSDGSQPATETGSTSQITYSVTAEETKTVTEKEAQTVAIDTGAKRHQAGKSPKVLNIPSGFERK